MTSPLPSMFGGRASRRHDVLLAAAAIPSASSIVTMRSSVGDEGGQNVEHGRLAGAGSTGNHHIEAPEHTRFEEGGRGGVASCWR